MDFEKSKQIAQNYVQELNENVVLSELPILLNVANSGYVWSFYYDGEKDTVECAYSHYDSEIESKKFNFNRFYRQWEHLALGLTVVPTETFEHFLLFEKGALKYQSTFEGMQAYVQSEYELILL